MHQNKHQNKYIQHVPVLLEEVLQYLNPHKQDSYLDVTAGYGGHAREILELTTNFKDSVLVDRDENAVKELTKEFQGTDIEIRWEDFLTSSQELINAGRQFDLILGDLGVSSPHLNEGNRGFAIKESAPLDMRMDQRQAVDARTILNTYSEDAIADILKVYGEEPKSRLIARMIVEHRPLQTTDELAAIASRAWPGHSRVHPATRTFQALRIAVNDELRLLEQALPIWFQLLSPGGRIGIISFHSLEDRIVKHAFNEKSGNRYDAELQLVTKHPVTASTDELAFNPRSRSAKLRVAVKIKTKKKGNA
jgi:16S rRNA (cytosine1402-N4)-methyltransferase